MSRGFYTYSSSPFKGLVFPRDGITHRQWRAKFAFKLAARILRVSRLMS